jgi:hypothetical protein
LRPRDLGDWSFDERPSNVQAVATSEDDFYPWYLWLIAGPVAHASNAVREDLNSKGAGITPAGRMKANEVRRALGGGAADIVQRSWAMEGPRERPQERPCALYEFKRDNALLVNDQGTLTRLVELARVPGGYNFKTGAKGAPLGSNEGKILNLLSQASLLLQDWHAR